MILAIPLSTTKPLYLNGEAVITSGRDVSKYLVDISDDEDPPFTFRSVVLGTVIGGLGPPCLRYVVHYQTISMQALEHSLLDIHLQACTGKDLNSVLLVIYSFGVFWAMFVPKCRLVERTRFEWLGLTLHFINPSKFKLKETCPLC